MSMLTKFGRTEHRLLSERIQQAIGEIADEFGVNLTVGGGRLDTNGGRIDVKVALRDVGGTGVSAAEQAFRLHANYLGLKPDDYGKEIHLGGQRFEIVGLNLNAPKFPVLIHNLGTGKTHKAQAQAVKTALAA